MKVGQPVDVNDKDAVKALDEEQAVNAIRWFRDRGRDAEADQLQEATKADVPDAKAPTATNPVEEPTVDTLPNGFETFNVQEVLDWVSEPDDEDAVAARATVALAEEMGRPDPRKGVVEALDDGN